MPELKDIKRFNEILFTLGSEPQILKERNEEIEEIPIPENSLPSDVSELLDTPVDNGTSDNVDADLNDISFLDSGSNSDTGDFDSSDDHNMSLDIPGIPDTSVDTDTSLLDDIPFDSSISDDTVTGTPLSGDDMGDFSLPGDLSDSIVTDSTPPGDDMADFSLPDDLGTDTTPPGDDMADFSLPDDLGTDTTPPGDDMADFSLPDDLGTDTTPPGDDMADFSLPDDLGTDTTPPGDDMADFSLPGDLGTDTTPPGDDMADFSLPDDLGTDTTPPGDDMADFSLPGDLGTDTTPPGDDIADFSLPGDLGTDTTPPGDDIADLSLPADLSDSTDADTAPPGNIPSDFSLSDDLGTDTIEPGGEISSDIDSFEINDEDEFFIDEFSIPDEEDEIDALSDIYAPKEGEEGGNQFGEVIHEEEDISISEAQLQAIQKTLNILPLNLKIKVEELIGLGQAIGDDLRSLLDMLIKNASPSEIAEFVSQITGEKVILPKRFEKKTGVAFEEERKSFTYVLRENLLPLLSVFIPSLIILTIITIGGYNLKIWLDAQEQFKRGIYYIEEENEFALGNDEFTQAYQKAQDNKWYFRYAESFILKNQYEYAREKYEQLLNMKWEGDAIEYITRFNKQGIIDYAQFESKTGGNYKKADALLGYLLFREPYDKEGLLAAGDNYLEWSKDDESYFKPASDMYAKYKNKYGDTPEIMFRYLRFFIGTDNYDKVIELKDLFQSREKIKVDPEVYAQLAGYLLDYNQITDVRDILARALEADRNLPEIHYQLARYLHIMKEPREEEKALLKAKDLYKSLPPLALYDRVLVHYIDTCNMLGELYYSNGRTGLAERELDTAIALLEDRQNKKMLGYHEDLGKVYYNRGNIFFDLKDFSAALDHYEKAENNLYDNPEMNYKKGYVHYRDDKHLNALLEFYKAEKGIRNNKNILFAIGNALYYRGDFFAAQGYYTHLLSILEKKRGRIEYIQPDENPEHKSLFNFMMRAYNNLGVTVKKLSEVSRNEGKESGALVYLTKSSEYYDILDRLIENPETMNRDKVTKNLAYLNQRHIFYPQTNYSLSIYNTIPVDTRTLDIDHLFSTTIGE